MTDDGGSALSVPAPSASGSSVSGSSLGRSGDGGSEGCLWVVGLGPGRSDWRTPEAAYCLARATDVVGYSTYVRQVGELAVGQRAHEFDNRQEADRARFALDLAAGGARVALVSSGDPGIFAMATAVMEELHRDQDPAFGDGLGRWAGIEVVVVPGITAAVAVAARVGAPLGHDLCLISLSDVLKPWEVIERRLRKVAEADLVIALYNPHSRARPWQLGRALAVLGEIKEASDVVVVARNVGRSDETIDAMRLSEVDPDKVDMSTVLIVGSSTTRTFVDSTGQGRVYTPRTYGVSSAGSAS